ncbi:MAG TPA: hypothetical protein VMR66_11275 [Gemmatimonadota bacterium]|nr:hypothetical protein [Gemmatimonadota bacterium]
MRRLAAPLARLAPVGVLRWLERRRARHREHADPLPAAALEALAPFFPAATLEAARLAVVDRLREPRLVALGRRLGLGIVALEEILGITYVDTIVVPRTGSGEVPLSTLFHELVHVEQARQLGARGFVERYARGWLEGGYRGIPLERDAYALERRFRAAPDQPFDVAAEVARRLNPTPPSAGGLA